MIHNKTSPVNQQSIHLIRLLNKRSSAEMCFLNQVIKVLFAAAISGAVTVFSLGSRTHLASLGRALQYVAEIDLFMRRRLYDYVRGEFVCACSRLR